MARPWAQRHQRRALAASVAAALLAWAAPSCGDGDRVPPPGYDSDRDGLSDDFERSGWEIRVDRTGNGMQLASSILVTSDPQRADTDGDGLDDGLEFDLRTDPAATDTDGDGLDDSAEWLQWHTNPITVDTDGDACGPDGSDPPQAALFDGNELCRCGTSPTLDDTDGDGRTDFEEYDHPSYHPLIAELPRAEIVIDGDIDVRLNVEYAENLGAETQYGTTLAESRTDTRRSSRSTTHSVGVAVTVGFETEFGLFGGTTLSTSVTASYDYSTQVTTEQETAVMLQQESSRYMTDSRELSEVNASGTISVPMRLRNVGNSTFTLTDLQLAVLHWSGGQDPSSGSFRVMTTLDAARGEYTLAPAAQTPILQVVNANVDAAVIKEFLAHPDSLILEPAMFDLRDQYGINYDFLLENTFQRTALLEIDTGERVESYRVATNVERTAGGGYCGLSMARALNDILGIRRDDPTDGYLVTEVPADAQGRAFPAGVFALTGLRGRHFEAGDRPDRPRAFWAVASTNPAHTDPHLSFEDIVLCGGDQVRLIYTTDADRDGVYGFEEEHYGNSDAAEDSDGDQLDDFTEVKVGWCIGSQGRRVYSNPRLRDTDGDGWDDRIEYLAGTDPTDPDTDDDGLLDAVDPAPLHAAVRLHVRPGGNGDGLSWAHAMADLQVALAEATRRNELSPGPADDVSEIWVARGRYTLTARGESFVLKNRLGIYGGFAGHETKLGARDANPMSNGMILSGNVGDGSHALHVVRADGDIDTSAVLDGFMIAEGRADGVEDEGRGAGLLCLGVPTLRNLFFYDNRALDCGGGLFHRATAAGSQLVLTGCAFSHNTARTAGGAIGTFATGDGAVTVRGCTFEENITADLAGTPTGSWYAGGGAICHASSGLLTVDLCRFRSNQTGRDGVAPGFGSAVWVAREGGRGLFTTCDFLQNIAWGHEGDGGYGYGTVTGAAASTLAFANCCFAENRARQGAAVLGAVVHMVNCTVVDNLVTQHSSWLVRYPVAGAVHVANGAALTNCVLWGNRCPGAYMAPERCQYLGGLRATYSIIEALDRFVGINTTRSDPRLDNLRPANDSPCIDAGTNFVDADPFRPELVPLPAYDLDGFARIIDGDGVGGAVVDIGAFERQGG
jgi:hypothetical protein